MNKTILEKFSKGLGLFITVFLLIAFTIFAFGIIADNFPRLGILESHSHIIFVALLAFIFVIDYIILDKIFKKDRFIAVALFIILILLMGAIYVSLSGTGPSRAKNPRIIADMNQIRSSAELFNNENSTYTGLEESIRMLTDDIKNQGGELKINIKNDGSAYCVYTKLVINDKSYWCVDNNLTSADTNGIDPGKEGYCDGKTFMCPGSFEEVSD